MNIAFKHQVYFQLSTIEQTFPIGMSGIGGWGRPLLATASKVSYFILVEPIFFSVLSSIYIKNWQAISSRQAIFLGSPHYKVEFHWSQGHILLFAGSPPARSVWYTVLAQKCLLNVQVHTTYKNVHWSIIKVQNQRVYVHLNRERMNIYIHIMGYYSAAKINEIQV